LRFQALLYLELLNKINVLLNAKFLEASGKLGFCR
jgi:hypothetical protein